MFVAFGKGARRGSSEAVGAVVGAAVSGVDDNESVDSMIESGVI